MRLATILSLLLVVAMFSTSCKKKRTHRVVDTTLADANAAALVVAKEKAALEQEKAEDTTEASLADESAQKMENKLDPRIQTKLDAEAVLARDNNKILVGFYTDQQLVEAYDISLSMKAAVVAEDHNCELTLTNGEISTVIETICPTEDNPIVESEESLSDAIVEFKALVEAKYFQLTEQEVTELEARDIYTRLVVLDNGETKFETAAYKLSVIKENETVTLTLLTKENDQVDEASGDIIQSCDLITLVQTFKSLVNPKKEETADEEAMRLADEEEATRLADEVEEARIATEAEAAQILKEAEELRLAEAAAAATVEAAEAAALEEARLAELEEAAALAEAEAAAALAAEDKAREDFIKNEL